MTVKLLTKHHLAVLSFKEAAQAHLSIKLSKWQIVKKSHVVSHTQNDKIIRLFKRKTVLIRNFKNTQAILNKRTH